MAFCGSGQILHQIYLGAKFMKKSFDFQSFLDFRIGDKGLGTHLC